MCVCVYVSTEGLTMCSEEVDSRSLASKIKTNFIYNIIIGKCTSKKDFFFQQWGLVNRQYSRAES